VALDCDSSTMDITHKNVICILFVSSYVVVEVSDFSKYLLLSRLFVWRLVCASVTCFAFLTTIHALLPMDNTVFQRNGIGHTYSHFFVDRGLFDIVITLLLIPVIVTAFTQTS
jgi:hypothetical protein